MLWDTLQWVEFAETKVTAPVFWRLEVATGGGAGGAGAADNKETADRNPITTATVSI